MNLFDKNKMSFWTRIRLCWRVLVTGTLPPLSAQSFLDGWEEYRSRNGQKQWETCKKRCKELEKTIRPRTTAYQESEFGDQ